MKLNSTQKVLVFALFLIPVISSVVLSINLNTSAAAQNDYVGGTIISTSARTLGPWVAIMGVLAIIVVAAYMRGKNIHNM